MKEKNNFKELEEFNLLNAPPLSEKIKGDILGTKNLFNYLGDLVDMCLPKVFDLILSLFSANEDSKKEKETK